MSNSNGGAPVKKQSPVPTTATSPMMKKQESAPSKDLLEADLQARWKTHRVHRVVALSFSVDITFL